MAHWVYFNGFDDNIINHQTHSNKNEIIEIMIERFSSHVDTMWSMNGGG